MPYFDVTESPTLHELQRLDGRVALVTGGAGYLGSQAADVLAELGAQVVIASRDDVACKERASEIGERHPGAPTPVGLLVDVTDQGSIDDLVGRVSSELGRLDVLANFSWSGRKNSFDSIDESAWLEDIDVSLNGPFRLIKAVVPLLRATGGGAIVNVASMYGVVAPDWGIYPSDEFTSPPSYGAAKAGVLQLTRYLASFLADSDIRVNALSPGPFPFPETMDASPEFARRLRQKNPMKRIGLPHELRGAIAFLCSDASSFVTGQNLCVDGGWTAW